MNEEISRNLKEAAEVWGVDITRTEITILLLMKKQKHLKGSNLTLRKVENNNCRSWRWKTICAIKSRGKLYEAQKEAESLKVTADAEAYSVKIKAQADADQTKLLAEAISKNGQPAVNFEIMKRQVEAIGKLASSDSSKTLIVPTEVTGILGGIETLMDTIQKKNK